ncbi:MAG: tripartite tricarboxylate transporter substrate-binding protein, partial [Roseococcus sp.]
SEGLTAGVKYGVGRSSDRVTITNPSDFGSLTESHKALLAQASAADVIETQYRRYEWIGEEATVDLSAVGTFNNALLWREVGATARAPVNLPVLASSDGIADVVKGQWVENRRDLLSVTLQVTDDINISASGDVAVKTPGDVVMRAKDDLRIAEGSRSITDLSGIDAGARMRLAAGGAITALGSVAQPWLLRSGGDMSLLADGSSKVSTLAGRIAMVFDVALTGVQTARGGQARAFAVTSAGRSPALPEVPSLREIGLDAEMNVWQAIFTATATPAPIQAGLQRPIAAAMGTEAMARRMAELGVDRIVANTPEQAQRYVAAEVTRWEALLRGRITPAR